MISSSSSELYISSHELSSTNVPESPGTPPPKTIPLNIVPTTVPQVITTTKTLRRCCGFSLAIFGFIFYCVRALLALWWIIKYLLNEKDSQYSTALLLEAVACSTGITNFLRIMKNPKLTLKASNFKNVWMFTLIPILSFGKCFLVPNHTYILPAIESLFFSGYIYSLSLNGRSSSFWAGFKPYTYAMVPLILPIPPASKAFPQYTVPPPLTSKMPV